MAPTSIKKHSRVKNAKPSSRDKVGAHLEFEQQGLRPVQFWLPDTRSPEFAAEAHRQSLAISNSPSAHDDQAFIDSLSDCGDD